MCYSLSETFILFNGTYEAAYSAPSFLMSSISPECTKRIVANQIERPAKQNWGKGRITEQPEIMLQIIPVKLSKM